MAKKLTTVVLASILLAGCAQFAEMEETRVAGNSYLTGRFYEQIGELETLAAKSPELGYSTARIVQEILPPKGSGTAWVARTKYSKIEYPMTKEEFNIWMNTIDGNIAKLKDKINAAAEEAKRKEEERIAEAKRQEEALIANNRKEWEIWVATVNNRFCEVYQGLHSLSSTEMPGDQFRVTVIDAVKAEMSTWQNIYNSLTNEYGVDTSPYVASPNEENPWRVQLNTTSDIKWLDLPIRNLESFSVSTGDGSKHLFQTEYNRCADFIKRVQEKVNVAIKQAAEEKSKAEAAARLLADMPESEKFPLLSVQPKPQVLMKNIHSGTTKKWVDAWLVANKIEHNEDSEFLGERLEDLIIKASFRNENGDVVRQIDFGFRDNVLLNLTINLDGTAATSLDDVVEKYSHDLGPSVNIERKEGEAVVRIMTDDICVCAGDRSGCGYRYGSGNCHRGRSGGRKRTG